MLRIIPNTSADSARSYYSHGDYLAEGQESPGVWRGLAAERLGLSGLIRQADFDALCDNRLPGTDQPLTLRTNTNRTVGYDFNFHVPKSVSLLFALNQDADILTAFRASVNETMAEIEKEALTRVRKNGADELRPTGNLVWGEFIHFTARPVNGEPDPHLHAHCFVFNATHDGVEDAWKAGFFGSIKRVAPYFEAYFHAAMARRLADLGYPIEKSGKGWEVRGFEKSTLDKFSRRTNQIESMAAEKGISDPELKSDLGAKSREKKISSLTMPELRDRWRGRMDERELAALQAIGRSEPILDDPDAVSRSLDYAMRHHFERESVVAEKRLLATALKDGVGQIRPKDLSRFVSDPASKLADGSDKNRLIRRVVEGQTLTTTVAVLAEEEKLVAFARDGRGRFAPLGPASAVLTRDWLNADQQQAVRQLLTSTDRVTLLSGKAGVGKTTLLKETVEQIEATGQKVFTFAPSADASRGTLRKEGFTDAETVAKLLADKELQAQTQGAVLLIDEAGLLGTRDVARLFNLAEQNGNRILLAGDMHQHHSVARGSVLRILQEQAGLIPATASQIQRQKGQYKAAVTALAEGRTEEGFQKLDDLGWIHEVSETERVSRIAQGFVDTVEAGRTALCISPTHKEGQEVAEAIRRELKARGRIGKDDRRIRQLTDRQLTVAERSRAENLPPGTVIQFHRPAKGHKAGERIVVTDERQPLPLDQAERYGVFASGELPVAAGDLLRITKNGTTLDGHRLNNGALYHLKGFTKEGDLQLDNGWVVSQDYGHLAHGYVSTSHSAQGKTVDHVFVSQSSKTYRASSKEQFYVSASRARHGLTLFCDSKELLREAVSQSDPRLAATELVRLDRHTLPRGPHPVPSPSRKDPRRQRLVRQAESRPVLITPSTPSLREVTHDRE